MILLIYVSTLLLFGSAWSSKSANDYMDSVLHSALQFELRALNIDPLFLPDFKTDFDDQVKLFGNVHGTVKYTDGELSGLSLARRYTECNGPSNFFGTTSINCTILLDDLRTLFKGKMKYGKLPSVPITAESNMSTTLLFVDVASYPQNPTPLLREFRFLQIGQVKTKFSGLGSLNRYLSVLDSGYKDHVWPAFFNTIGQGFRYALGRAVTRVPLPWY